MTTSTEGSSGIVFVATPNSLTDPSAAPTGRIWRKRAASLDTRFERSESESDSAIDSQAGDQAIDHAAKLAAGVPRALKEVLTHRGLKTDADLNWWFRPNLKSLRDPLSLKELDRAVRRLVVARQRQEHVLLYADYDLDGTSGLALALEAFQLLGFENVSGYQPQRLTEGYGLHSEAIEKLHASRGVQVLVSIDLGITAMEEAQFAKSLGIDVIITDHHLPKTDETGAVVLPDAVAVVNPNRGDCESGLGHLCGTGVIFYLVLALRRALLEEGLLISDSSEVFDPKRLLDCFAIGTITDLVPLQAENRILVKHGLVRLAETERPGLSELLKALDLWGRPLTAQDVAIRFAPKLNALSRMGSGIQPIDLYLENDREKAREMVAQVLANNQDRQASQKLADEEADRILSEAPPKGVIAICSEKFHRGVVGLVATKLSQRFGLPAFVGAIEGESGSIIGSARVPTGLRANLLEAMAHAANHLDQFGGHAMAAGFEAKRSEFHLFRSALETWAAMLVSDDELGGHVVEFDAACTLSELTPSFMNWYEHMGPFGSQAPVPMFLLRDCLVSQAKSLKGGHWRLRLAQVGAPPIQAIWFSPPKVEGVEDFGHLQGQRVDVIGEVQWNHYQGSRTIQLLVSDMKIASSAVAAGQNA